VLGASRILIELCADFLVTLGRTRAVFLAQLPWLLGLLVASSSWSTTTGSPAPPPRPSWPSADGPIYLLLLRRAESRAWVWPGPWCLRCCGPGSPPGSAYLVASQISNPYLGCLAGAAPAWRATWRPTSAIREAAVAVRGVGLDERLDEPDVVSVDR
jgi:hypothetical protein